MEIGKGEEVIKMTLKSANEILEKNANGEELARFAYADLLAYIATFFIKYRFEKKLTQKELAQLLGISQVMISKIENGKWNFSIEKLNNYVRKINAKLVLKIESESTIEISKSPLIKLSNTSNVVPLMKGEFKSEARIFAA